MSPRATCGCCGREATFDLYERAIDTVGVTVDLRVCPVCSVVTTVFSPTYAPNNADQVAQEQGDSSEGFYEKIMPADLEALREEIGKHGGIIDFLNPLLGTTKDKTFAEVGYGRGLLLLAASDRFEEAIGFEVQHRSFQRLVKNLYGEMPSNISVLDQLDQSSKKFDVLALWHTMEHLPNPRAILKPFINRLNDRGLFYAQVPLYRPAYLCPTHYWFFNARSVGFFLKSVSLRAITIDFDLANGFLTILATREPRKERALRQTRETKTKLKSILQDASRSAKSAIKATPLGKQLKRTLRRSE